LAYSDDLNIIARGGTPKNQNRAESLTGLFRRLFTWGYRCVLHYDFAGEMFQ